MQKSSDDLPTRRASKWAKIDTIAELGQSTKTFNLDLGTQSKGLYIAFQDGGSCSIIQQGMWFIFCFVLSWFVLGEEKYNDFLGDREF